MPDHIPVHLVEQIKDRNYQPNAFYDFHRRACVNFSETTTDRLVLNNNSRLYVLSDKDYKVAGFCWITIDSLSGDLSIQILSVDKSLWRSGIALKKAEQLAVEVARSVGANKIYWVTKNPKAFEKKGWKRSKYIVMEFEDNQENGQVENG